MATFLLTCHQRLADIVAQQRRCALLDSGNQKLATKELGGTGRTHDWRLSAEIRRAVRAPVFLAGGLRADNVSWILPS